MRCLLLGLMLVGVVGCSSPKTDSVAQVKTTGQLLSGKLPATGALVLFHRVGADAGQLPGRATVGPDGRFTVASADGGDGLSEGEYVVTVVWTAGTGENDEDGRSRVAVRYTSPASTPLKASVRPGADGQCTLPLFVVSN